MKPKIIILLGRSGCGKGTQAKLLQENFGLEYLGSGEMLRARAKLADYSGQTLQVVLAGGGFAPTSLIFKLWIDKLEEFKDKPDFRGLVFDGSPRKILEAHLIDEALGWYGWKDLAKIFLIDISREAAFNRLAKRRICQGCGQLIPYVGEFKNLEKCDKCGGDLKARYDDTPEAINSRLNLFEKEVQPVIDYYEKDGRLIKINGRDSIENIFKKIQGYSSDPAVIDEFYEK